MQIAKIKDNKVEAVGEHTALFPNTSFPVSGPPADWMTQNSVLPVTMFRTYNGPVSYTHLTLPTIYSV